MSFNKKNFYLHTPSGEMMLVEAFLRDENMTILFGTRTFDIISIEDDNEFHNYIKLIAREKAGT